MRLNGRLIEQRLQRVRARAKLARTSIAALRKEPLQSHPAGNPLPPLPALSELRCGRRCDAENPQSPARRAAERTVTSAEILLRRLGSADLHVRLRDISTGGCRFGGAERLDVNDHLVARLPGLEPIGATVIWSDGRNAGLRFDRPLHPVVFELLLMRLG